MSMNIGRTLFITSEALPPCGAITIADPIEGFNLALTHSMDLIIIYNPQVGVSWTGLVKKWLRIKPSSSIIILTTSSDGCGEFLSFKDLESYVEGIHEAFDGPMPSLLSIINALTSAHA